MSHLLSDFFVHLFKLIFIEEFNIVNGLLAKLIAMLIAWKVHAQASIVLDFLWVVLVN